MDTSAPAVVAVVAVLLAGRDKVVLLQHSVNASSKAEMAFKRSNDTRYFLEWLLIVLSKTVGTGCAILVCICVSC